MQAAHCYVPHEPGSAGAKAHAAMLWRAAKRGALRLLRADQAAKSWVALDRPTEKCVRHDYNAATKEWTQSVTSCKMEHESFAEGAMRRCYRLLKETQAPNVTDAYRDDWHHSSAYVAKEYKDPSVGSREAYERDCQMQQDAKLWGARWNALHPPKPVDFLQCFLLELVERPGSPIFACERIITGDYIKHNSNSGYVECHRRATPQAFSHFTFQASHGRVMIVDIQGVNDLYTDPQMHTLDGTGYGEGNLGANGFALFFAAHRCSPLCAKMKLAELPKSETEMARDEHAQSEAASMQLLSLSQSSGDSSATAQVRTWRSAEEGQRRPGSEDVHSVEAALRAARSALTTAAGSHASREAARRTWAAREAKRWITVVQPDALPGWALDASSWGADALPAAAELRAARLRRVSLGSLARNSMAAVTPAPDTWVLFAPVHLALARYYACGGLQILDGVPDEVSAVFHTCYAARGGDSNALHALRDLMRGVVQDLVPGVRLAEESLPVAAALTAALARAGDVAACVEHAEAVPTAAEKLLWLEQALAAMSLHAAEAAKGEAAPDAAALEAAGLAPFQLLEKVGRARLVAGDASAAGDAFTAASEDAALHGKGKLSLKLTTLAEEAYAQVEEGDECGSDAPAE